MPAARTPFTKKELGELRRRLEEERNELRRQATEIEEASFRGPQSELTGELSSFDEEYADAGTATFERERDLSIRNNIQDLMGQIDRAIARIDEGKYGICEGCGSPISPARLEAMPAARFCIDCASKR